MKGRFQTDLIWRFQVADTQLAGIPSVAVPLPQCGSHGTDDAPNGPDDAN